MQTLKAKYGTEEEENLGFEVGITATLGGQAGAYQLTKKWNEVNTNPAGGGVKLLPMKIGSSQALWNRTAENLIVYPTIGESINAIVDYAFVIGPGGFIIYECPHDTFSFSSDNSL